MAESEIHVGDVGTVFVLTVYDGDELVDVSGATTKQVRLMDPGGNTVAKDASFTTNGTDGKIQHTTVLGDMDETGWWQIQAYLVLPTWRGHSDIAKFIVYGNL